jgi:hypothetical protein
MPLPARQSPNREKPAGKTECKRHLWKIKSKKDLREENTDIVNLLVDAHILKHFVTQIKDVLNDYKFELTFGAKIVQKIHWL